MHKYCITAANHNNAKGEHASEFRVWMLIENKSNKWVWNSQGNKSLEFIVKLLVQGDEVISGKECADSITPGYPFELDLKIARNDKNLKITDLPTL